MEIKIDALTNLTTIKDIETMIKKYRELGYEFTHATDRFIFFKAIEQKPAKAASRTKQD